LNVTERLFSFAVVSQGERCSSGVVVVVVVAAAALAASDEDGRDGLDAPLPAGRPIVGRREARNAPRQRAVAGDAAAAAAGWEAGRGGEVGTDRRRCRFSMMIWLRSSSLDRRKPDFDNPIRVQDGWLNY